LAGFALFWAALFLLGFGWEQKVTRALEHWWLQASPLVLAGVSGHHYTVDSFFWRRAAGL
jgi:hypothetical protein